MQTVTQWGVLPLVQQQNPTCSLHIQYVKSWPTLCFSQVKAQMWNMIFERTMWSFSKSHLKENNYKQPYILAHLLIKPVSLDYWGTRIPPDGIWSLPKVMNFFRRSWWLEMKTKKKVKEDKTRNYEPVDHRIMLSYSFRGAAGVCGMVWAACVVGGLTHGA